MNKDYTESAVHALHLAGGAAQFFHMNRIGTEHLLVGLLDAEDGAASILLAEAGVKRPVLIAHIERLVAPSGNAHPAHAKLPDAGSVRADAVMAEAQALAEKFGHQKIGTEHLLIALLEDTECIATRLLHTMNIDLGKLHAAAAAAIGAEAFYTEEEMSGAPQAASAGETQTLDRFSTDLTRLAAEGKLDPVIGRNEEMTRLIQILSRRTKNNPCLIGEPGVGKTAIVWGLAQRIASDAVPETVRGMRLLSLDLPGMVAGTKYRGEFEERIRAVVREAAQNRNILLFIDELHTIIGAGGAEGALDAANILKPALSRGEIRIIGATTIDEYRKHIEKDAALERRFQPVAVEEPSKEEAVEILRGLRPYFEEHHGVRILDEALEAAVSMSERYINDRRLPDKAIDLIDEAASRIRIGHAGGSGGVLEKEQEIRKTVSETEDALIRGDLAAAKELRKKQAKLEAQLGRIKEKYEKKQAQGELAVGEEAIAEVVSQTTKIPVTKLAESETKRLAKLEETLHKRIIGQDEAVRAVANAVKRGRVGLKNPKRPTGSFLFLGPTGVGKTELSKVLAEAVYGSEASMIRVDMSEYMEKYSVSKMIGSPPGYVGYDEGGQLSEQVRRHPYSVLLFDEIEKAHPDVFNILLQVLDEGHITDAHGRKVDFKNTCIIMSSNAGAQAIIEPKRLGFGASGDTKKEYEDMKRGVMEEVRRLFKPEFLNRIDDIIVFHPLTREETVDIAALQLKELTARAKDQMNVTLKTTDSLKQYIAREGYSEKYGARPIRRLIQDKIEDHLSEMILNGEMGRGDTVRIRFGRDEKLHFEVL